MKEIYTKIHSPWRHRLLMFIFIALIFVAGYWFGQYRAILTIVHNNDGDVSISKVLDLYGKTRSEDVSFEQFWDIWQKLKEKYVRQPVSDVDLFYGALVGMVDGLGDPYSMYLPPQEAAEFAQDLSGEFAGIGAHIGKRDNEIVVIAPLANTPADKAGLKAGDVILAIDDEDTFSLSVDEAVKKIRGEVGTEVRLLVTSNGYDTAHELTIVRSIINVPSVEWDQKEHNIAYMRMSHFADTTWKEFDKAVKEIVRTNPHGLILDLRSNPGGYLDTSVMIASEWIDNDAVIVSQKNYAGESIDHRAVRGNHRLSTIPTIVLIDKGSASASEIVAGALQDYKKAQLLGETSFGKGSVQDFEALPDGSALKLTTALWYTPLGRQIDEKGINPDITIEEMYTQIDGTDGTHEEDFVDNALNKAIELLQ